MLPAVCRHRQHVLAYWTHRCRWGWRAGVERDEGMTMTQVVGRNVREHRTRQRLSQDQLRVALGSRGIKLSRPTVAQLEAGKRPISVDEILALGLALGIAPHLLMYPPAGTR